MPTYIPEPLLLHSWHTDITYLPTDEGWLYLATAIDLATREVIGYAMADHHRADRVCTLTGVIDDHGRDIK